MEKLEKRFNKWHQKFLSNKDSFQKILKKWESKGWKKSYDHGFRLFEKLERLDKELTETFVEKNTEYDSGEISSKIKLFKKTYKELREYTKPIIRQWIEAILVAGIAVILLRNFLFSLYHVPTGSAEPTLLVGDRVFGNKLAYLLFNNKPKHGDYIIIDNPLFVYDKRNPINYFWQKYVGFDVPLLGLSAGPDSWTKRVIATPGDTIEGKVENGKTVVYLNGKKLDEPYVNPYPLICLDKKTGFIDLDSFGPIPVPGFLKLKSKPVFYTYDQSKDYSDQPFYNMDPKELIYQPGTLQRWLKPSGSPTMNYKGKSVDEFGPYVIPKGKYWVMGDSRRNSADSREWGFLDEDLIHGRASFIIYSIDSEEPFWLLELIKHPINFWKKSVRWNRFFKGISNDNRIK